MLTKDKNFYKTLLTLAIPIALQNLITFSVAMADTVMLGKLGVVPLAAANLANKFANVYTLLCFGLASGANVIMAQYWGKKDRESIKRVMSIMYRALIVGALVFSVVSIFFPMQVMRMFSNEASVIEAGASYLRIIGFTYFLAGFSSTSVMVLRSVGSVNIALVVYLSSLVVNASCNYVLIFGKLGLPALGMRGAAIGTLIARIVEVLIVLVYYAKFEKKIGYRFSDFLKPTKEYSASFRNAAAPVIINEIIWGLGSAVISAIIGHMGQEYVAADSVCNILSQLVTIFIWGIGHASAALIGNTIGQGNHEKAREYAKTLQILSVGLGFVSGIVVLLLKNPMISIFQITDTSKQYAADMIHVYAFIVIFQAIAAVCLIGILRGSGNSKFVLYMDIVFMWIVSIPLGYIAGLKLMLPISVVYTILRADEIFKAVSATIKLSRGNWIQNVVQVHGDGELSELQK